MVEFNFKCIERFFSKLSAYFRHFAEVVVVIDIEMFGFNNLPVEFFVLDFIASEEIKLGGNYLRNID